MRNRESKLKLISRLRRNRDPVRRLIRRALPTTRRTLAAALFAFLVVGIALGRQLVIIPHLYERNLRTDHNLLPMEPPARGERILVFAPHPDDETLGCGGYIQDAVAAGAQVHIALMTNGEYPEIDLQRLEEKLHLERDSFIKLGLMRQMESISALGYLGIPSGNVAFLGYPNRYLDDMWLPAHWSSQTPVRSARTRTTFSPFENSLTGRAVFCGESALRDVESVLLREQPDIVFTMHPNDVHQDHWPTYALVDFALDELAAGGQGFAERCRVYTYLVHRDSWPSPPTYRPKSELEPPASLTQIRRMDWLTLPLTHEQTERKHMATSHYRTQGGSIDPLLRSFSRANELYAEIPPRAWRDGEKTSPVPVIIDPEADLVTSAAHKSGDISLVSLGRNGDRLIAEIVTRGTASKKTGYHLTIHAGREDAADRVVAEYDWQGSNAHGLVFSDGRLHRIDDMRTGYRNNISTVEAPWPMADGRQTFFLIRAWTTKGTHIVDQTATGTCLIENG